LTLLDLKTAVRQRADMENSSFVSDTELLSLINNSYAELYDSLVSRFEDYYSKKDTFSLSGTNTHTLPSDFYKIRGLDYTTGVGTSESVSKWNFSDRNSSQLGHFRSPRKYRIMGQSLTILPAESADGSYVMWYIPRYSKLNLDTDTLSDVMDFDEYIIVDSAIKCLVKEESDPTILLSIKEGLKQRILALASNRDSEPDTIEDVSQISRTFDYWGF
jgi:hypothetical protein